MELCIAKKLQQILGMGRAADIITLDLVTPMLPQEPGLLFMLNAFSNDPEPECLGQVDHAFYQGLLLITAEQVADKTPVDLDAIDRHMIEPAQRRILRAEVIDGYFYTQLPQLLQHAQNIVKFLHRYTFGNFQIQIFRLQPGLGKYVFQNSYKFGIEQLEHGHIHRNMYRR